MGTRVSVAAFLILTTVSAAVYSWEQGTATAEATLSTAATELLESVSDSQKEKLQLPYDSPERVKWNFVPLETRVGLPLKEMNDGQREQTRGLLAAALSTSGYKKATDIMELEKLLTVLEGSDRRWPRDYLLYYTTLFGEPGGEEPWGFRFEGHHMSLNFVIDGDEIVASTPQFLGANPAEIRTAKAGFKKGTRVLGGEETKGFALLNALRDEVRQKAIVSKQAPKEIRDPGSAQPPTEPPVGVAVSEMNEEERQALRDLIMVYASTMPDQVMAKRRAEIRKAGFEEVHFAWMGSEEPGAAYGYRVQGPSFVIELVNSQPDAEGNPANHVHSVWRDMHGDFHLPIEGGNR